MPAPLKSTACTNCKAKRTKVSWLTMTFSRMSAYRCILRSVIKNGLRALKCAGPSTLIKFVARGRDNTGPSPENVAVLATGESSIHQALAMVTRTPMKQYPGSNSGALSGKFRLRVPRPRFVTAADPVSGQLVRLLGSDLQATFTVLGELPELPQRLSHNSTLLHCVTLYCHAWSHCSNPRQPFHQLLQTSLYTKAIQGLQRAVQSETLYTLETLTVMVMMGSLISKCDMVSARDIRPHRLAIRHVVKTMGIPDLRSADASLHLSLIRITGFTMRNLAYFDNLDPSAYYDSPWIELFSNHDSFWADDSRNDDREFGINDDHEDEWDERIQVEATFELAHDILIVFTSRWRQRLWQIKANPSDMEAERALLIHRMCKAKKYLEVLARRLWNRLQMSGSISEHPDPDFFVGLKYKFSTYKVTRVAIHVIALRASLLRVLFDLYSLEAVFDGAIYETYRGLCFQVWACLPHLSTVHPLSAKDTLLMEAAESDELRYLYDIKIDWTVFGAPDNMSMEAFQNWIVARSAKWI
ncbi:unnamed protein product [Clonostachys rosea]|uniref:Transcription factor domain-containing protein n=1 Tax=Bionectria ochroleuca TaxID=29856 RepID=A0ABY6TR05_BIOOC|nr:unnamed protein product [Clonostachys rosea]